MRNQHDNRHRERGDVFLGQIPIAGQRALHVGAHAPKAKHQEHPRLHKNECAEANVGSLLPEELPQFVAEMTVKHGVSVNLPLAIH